MHTRAAVTLISSTCALALGACVTINIYFPAAAAEQAADRIIEEVWQIRKGETTAPPPQSPSPQ